MNSRHWRTLELSKILDRLAGHTQFSGGAKLAANLEPCGEVHEARDRLSVTSEARRLLDSRPDTTIGGARDVRDKVATAQRGAVLTPGELLDIRGTLVSGRVLQRALTRLSHQFPLLADIAGRIQPAGHLIDEIDRCLDDRGEVRDNASPELARARREMRINHDRLYERLQRLVSSSKIAPYLQEALITQRGGRYVIPLKADFKGRVRGIVHDQSASGATIFIEPMSTVDLNNKWREAQLAEEKEIQKVLATLSALVADEAIAVQWTVEALAELDLAFAKAKYAEAIEATAPELLPFSQGTGSPNSVVQLKQARHPLLDPATVVPIDVELDDETFIIVITGPNTGGKTVSLKTVGLLSLMAQCGLHIPAAEGSALSCFEKIFADIGDEQSIEQSLSTFSTHLTNILSFLGHIDARSLVLLDELGAGTDPAEGSALARAILDYMREREATTFVATHYPELKIYAHSSDGVANAHVEFDLDTLAPTYHLSIGLPGRSNAFAIAARLGMPDSILEIAQGMVDETDLHTEDLLSGIAQAYRETLQARDEAETLREETAEWQADLQARLTYVEDERLEVINQARKQARIELEQVRAEIATMRDKLKIAGVTLEALEGLEEEVEKSAEQMLAEPAPALEPAKPRRGERQRIRLGDSVWVEALQASGQVTALDRNEAEVQAGRLRLRVKVGELTWQAPPPESEPESSESASSVLASGIPESPGIEIDLRGLSSDEALPRVDKHLDSAALAGLPWVRIIHGHGTGILKRAVREMLRQHPLVRGYEAGKPQEGGEGVTVARLGNE